MIGCRGCHIQMNFFGMVHWHTFLHGRHDLDVVRGKLNLRRILAL